MAFETSLSPPLWLGWIVTSLALGLAGCAHRTVPVARSQADRHEPDYRHEADVRTEATEQAQLGTSSESRIALVIGNARYDSSPLANPTHDAQAIGDKLAQLGFDAQVLLDADRDQMKRAIKAFKHRLRVSSASVGIFYYSGHGLQVDGVNYLVPLDAGLEDKEEIEFQAVSADEVLAAMEAAHAGINMVFLDACRDNPFERSLKSGARGLAMMNAPSGTLIAYATAPGRTAIDGSGEYGVFSGALLGHLSDPGLTVEQVLKRTSADVARETAGVQTPWFATNWSRDVYLNPAGPVTAQEQLARSSTAYVQLSPSHEDVLRRELAPAERKLSLAAYGTMVGSVLLGTSTALVATAGEDQNGKRIAGIVGMVVGLPLSVVSAWYFAKDLKRRRAARTESRSRAAVPSSLVLQALSPLGLTF